MTLDEAKTLAAVIATADGGCTVCVGDLARQLCEAFPAFEWRALDDGKEGFIDAPPSPLGESWLRVQVTPYRF